MSLRQVRLARQLFLGQLHESVLFVWPCMSAHLLSRQLPLGSWLCLPKAFAASSDDDKLNVNMVYETSGFPAKAWLTKQLAESVKVKRRHLPVQGQQT